MPDGGAQYDDVVEDPAIGPFEEVLDEYRLPAACLPANDRRVGRVGQGRSNRGRRRCGHPAG